MNEPVVTAPDLPSTGLRGRVEAVGYRFSRWKIVGLSVALVLCAAGGLLQLAAAPDTSVASTNAPAESSSGSGGAAFKGSILPPGQTPPPTDPETASGDGEEVSEDRVWSPAMLRGGFGFFLGFCIGFATRVFLRLAAAFVGFHLILLMLSQYFGWVEVRWDTIQAQMEPVLSDLGAQFESFKVFVTGSIPTSGLAVGGFYTGVKRS